MPGNVIRPWSSVVTGRGQVRRPSGGLAPRMTPSKVPLSLARPTLRTRTSTPRAGAPVTSTSRTRTTCSGWSRMSAAGCSASGFSSAQPRPKPGRGGQRDDLEDAGRRGAGRVEPEPAVGVGLALAQQGELVDLVAGADPGRAGPRDQVDDRALDRLAVGVEHAAGDGHPARRAGSGFVSGRGRSASPARPAPRVAGSFTGSSFIASERVEYAGAGGDGGQEQQGHRDEPELVDQHGTQDLLGQGRGRGGEAPPAAACRAAKAIAARVVESHRRG